MITAKTGNKKMVQISKIFSNNTRNMNREIRDYVDKYRYNQYWDSMKRIKFCLSTCKDGSKISNSIIYKDNEYKIYNSSISQNISSNHTSAFINKIRHSTILCRPQQQQYIIMLPKGNHRCYQQLITLSKTIKQQHRQALTHLKQSVKIIAYTRQPLDIALKMLQHQTNLITYITNANYQTVLAVDRDTENISKSSQNQIDSFFMNKQLRVVNSFIDLHPYDAYYKICQYHRYQPKYLLTYPISQSVNNFINNIFVSRNSNYYIHPQLKDININNNHHTTGNLSILPLLSALRNKHLKVQGQLKLKKLEYRNSKKPEIDELISVIQCWHNHYYHRYHAFTRHRLLMDDKQEIQRGIKQQLGSRIWKIDYILNNLSKQYINGEQVQIEQVNEGYGQKQYYTHWL